MLGTKPIRKYMVTARRMAARNRDLRGAWNYTPSSVDIADLDIDSVGRRTAAWVVERIRNKEASFFMYVGLSRAPLQVVDDAARGAHLRAVCDDSSDDHLMALPVFA